MKAKKRERWKERKEGGKVGRRVRKVSLPFLLLVSVEQHALVGGHHSFGHHNIPSSINETQLG